MVSSLNDILYPQVLVLPVLTEAVRDTLVADVGTVIFNSTTSKLNFCKAKVAAAASWEAITSA